MKEGLGKNSFGVRIGGTRICEGHSGKFSSLKSSGVSYIQKTGKCVFMGAFNDFIQVISNKVSMSVGTMSHSKTPLTKPP